MLRLLDLVHNGCLLTGGLGTMQGTALAAVLAGKLAGHMQDKRGWDALRTRTLCQDIATVGKLLAAHCSLM